MTVPELIERLKGLGDIPVATESYEDGMIPVTEVRIDDYQGHLTAVIR